MITREEVNNAIAYIEEIDKEDASQLFHDFYEICLKALKAYRITEEDKTVTLIEILMKMKVRPGMYFGNNNRYDKLMAFISGFGIGANVYENEKYFGASTLIPEAWDRLDKEYELMNFDNSPWNNKLTDEERFEKYIDMIFTVFAEHYPEKATELGIGGK